MAVLAGGVPRARWPHRSTVRFQDTPPRFRVESGWLAGHAGATVANWSANCSAASVRTLSPHGVRDMKVAINWPALPSSFQICKRLVNHPSSIRRLRPPPEGWFTSRLLNAGLRKHSTQFALAGAGRLAGPSSRAALGLGFHNEHLRPVHLHVQKGNRWASHGGE